MNTTQTKINHLIKVLAQQLTDMNNSQLGLKSTYKKIALCSKTISQLVQLGLTSDQAIDQAEQIQVLKA